MLLRLACVFVLLLGVSASICAGPIRTVDNGGLTNYVNKGSITFTNGVSVPLGFQVQFFDQSRTTLYLSKNGYLSDVSSLASDPYDPLDSHLRVSFLAGFFSSWSPSIFTPVSYGIATVNAKSAFVATWKNIRGAGGGGGFGPGGGINSMQIVIISTGNAGIDYDVEYNYDLINAEQSVGALVGYATARENADGTSRTHYGFWTLPNTYRFIDAAGSPLVRTKGGDQPVFGRILLHSVAGHISDPSITYQAQLTGHNSAVSFDLLSNTSAVLDVQKSNYEPQLNDQFTVVQRGTGVVISRVNLPTLNPGLGWNMDSFLSDGSISVVRAPDHLSLFNPWVWLDASDIGTLVQSGGFVSRWIDKSGNGNDAFGTTAGSFPTYVPMPTSDKPVLRFNGSTSKLRFSGPLFSGNGARTLFFVLKKQGTSGPYAFFSDNNETGGEPFEIRTDGIELKQFSVTGFNANLLTVVSRYRLVTVVLGQGDDRGQIEVYENGMPLRSKNLVGVHVNSGAAGYAQLGTGRNPAVNLPFDGDIAEVLFYQRKLTPAEVVRVNTYFREKYGIPVTGTPIPFQMF